MRHKQLINSILGLLVLQFLLGMLANLYSTIPEQKPYEVFHQFGFIIFHALNAVALVVLAVVLVVKSRKQADFRRAVSGLVHLIIAFVFGELFVFTQQDIFSLFMALAFIGALLVYARLSFSSQTTDK